MTMLVHRFAIMSSDVCQARINLLVNQEHALRWEDKIGNAAFDTSHKKAFYNAIKRLLDDMNGQHIAASQVKCTKLMLNARLAPYRIGSRILVVGVHGQITVLRVKSVC